MKSIIFFAGLAVVLAGAGLVFAADEPFKFNDKEYYVVSSEDPAKDTGNEACALVGKRCVGYTLFDTSACTYFHLDASDTKSVNGSKAGFYCNGAPQKGLACEKNLNNCQVCPNCNVNVTCETQIGDQFREMYVECAATSTKISTGRFVNLFKAAWSMPGRWWGGLRSSIGGGWNSLRQGVRSMTLLRVKKAVIQVQGPKGMVNTEIPLDSYVCEFYQTNKKLVTCAAYKAADTFCTQAMQSRFARAAYCEENGIVICTNPCNPPESQVRPKQCAFDNARPRGNQAPPLDFCTENLGVKVDMGNLGKKAPGAQCVHGGECSTGNCLGQPSADGIKYFCSCDPFKLDYSCKP